MWSMRERRSEVISAPQPESGPEETGSGCRNAYSVPWRLLALLLVFRVCNAVLSYSAFVPDEYWQALEVAHRMTFGYP